MSTVLGVAQAAVEASEMDAVSTVLVVVRAVIEQLETMEENEQLARQLVTQLRVLLKVSSKLNKENCSTLEAAMDRVRQVLDALPAGKTWWARATRFSQATKHRDALESAYREVQGIVTVVTCANGAEQNAQLEKIIEKLAAVDLKKNDQLLRKAVEAGANDGDDEARQLREQIRGVSPDKLDEVLTSASKSPLKTIFVALSKKSTSQEWNAQEGNALSKIEPRDLCIDEKKILGRGAFGEVHAAEWKGKPVAVKRILIADDAGIAGLESTYEAERQLLLEARTWQELKSDNVVQMFGVCRINRRVCIVMERCDMSLDKRLYEMDCELTPEHVDVILRGTWCGVAFLHSRGIIHRDVKPLNVLLSSTSDAVKLTDFGLAKSKTIAKASTTGKGVKGTWQYLAPELMKTPQKWTMAADVYAMAITSWEVFHREPPWGSSNEPTIVTRVVSGERPKFDRGKPIKQWLRELVIKCWSPDDFERPTASDALEAFAESLSRRRPRTPPPSIASITSSAPPPDPSRIVKEVAQAKAEAAQAKAEAAQARAEAAAKQQALDREKKDRHESRARSESELANTQEALAHTEHALKKRGAGTPPGRSDGARGGREGARGDREGEGRDSKVQ